jgi:hypothetical protein
MRRAEMVGCAHRGMAVHRPVAAPLLPDRLTDTTLTRWLRAIADVEVAKIRAQKRELVQLGGKIDWAWIDTEIAPLYSDKGRPGIENRFVVGLLLLKHMFGLSDEGVRERWV